MKSFWIFILLPIYSFSQIAYVDDVQHIGFKLNHPLTTEDSTDIEGIDWQKEKLITTIELKGKIPLTYEIELKNDSTMVLSKSFQDSKEIVDTQNFMPFFWHIYDGYYYSYFKIIDFDNDNDEDLVCRLFTNVNGNEWTVIYINDQSQQKLVKLWNTANETDIWDDPHYNKKKKTIECELYSSAYGLQNTSTYKLQNSTATPLEMLETDLRNNDYIIKNRYIGESGKWKLVKSEKIK